METNKTLESPNNYLEKIEEIKLALFAETLVFTKIDNSINSALKDLLENIVDIVKKNPTVLNSGKSDIQDLISALKTKESVTDIKGGDIIGGLSLSEIADFINSLTGLIEKEKEFFWNIILLIFCGCDYVKGK